MFHRLTSLLLPLLFTVPAWPKTADYALLLNDPPLAGATANRASLRSTELQSRRKSILIGQRSLRGELSQKSIHVVGSVQTLLNAIFVRIPEERAGELKYIPGVQSVAYLPPLHRHLDRALDLTQVPAAWNLVGGVGNAGAGVKIAIIDTGIDQNHAAFQDTSLSIPTGFPKGDPAYTNRKVIAARSYVAQLPGVATPPETSAPDDNSPRDRVGHGTAMAMIAAGQRVTSPLAAITGVAPKAWLGNYKIYGSPGVNDETSVGALVQALEDALSDGMDIAAVASGSAARYGPLDRGNFCPAPSVSRSYIPVDACDVGAQAVENAIHLGLTVVVSAGDDGEIGYNFPALGTINTPGTAPSAITVGATTNSHTFFSAVSLSGGAPSNLRQIDAMTGEGPKPGSPLTAPLRDVSQLGNDGLACSALNAGSLTGAVALIQRGTCAFDVKVNNAQAAGAVAVLLYQSSGSDDLFVPTQLGDTAIPLLLGNTAASAIQTYLKSNANVSVTLDPSLHVKDTPADNIARFSSRGPSIGSQAIKPELVAVGAELYTATQTYDSNSNQYDPTGFTALSGTSFAVPLVAGAAALVKQAHPAYGPAQLKSAVVNTATANVNDESGKARVTSAGAGKLNAAGAVSSSLTVDPATVSFGSIPSGTLAMSQTLNLTNTGSSAGTFSVSFVARDADNNARLSVSPASIALNPGQSGAVTVRLDGVRPNAGTYEGQINIAGNGVTLHVPYLYLAGDGAPQNLFEIPLGATRVGFRVVDQFGVPVPNVAVRFRAVSGGGSINQGDPVTDVNGIAAANVSLGSQPGDQIFAADAGSLTLEFDKTVLLQPVIAANGVVNAASFEAARGLAPGSYITLTGSNLSPTIRSFVTPYLPISLVGVSVSFDVPSAGISVPGHISFVSGAQINVQIPWELRGQSSALIKVTINGVSSALYTVSLASSSPAAFEFTDPTSGQRLAAALDQNGVLITAAHPAQKGQAVSIYANGLGPVDNQPASGEPSPAQPLASTRVIPSVTIGGQSAQVLFSGLAPGFVGLYQINVVVPSDAPSGIQPLVISSGGVDSKASNLFLN